MKMTRKKNKLENIFALVMEENVKAIRREMEKNPVGFVMRTILNCKREVGEISFEEWRKSMKMLAYAEYEKGIR